jgi:hypothetical protein
LLKILHSAMENRAGGLEAVAFDRAEVTIFSVHLDREITRTITREPDAGREQSLLFDENVFGQARVRAVRPTSRELHWTTSPDDKEAQQGWAHRYLPTSRVYLDPRALTTTSLSAYWTASETDDQAARGEQRIEEEFATRVETLWTNYSAELGAKISQAQADGLASILRSVLTSKAAKEDVGPLDPEKAYRRVRAFLRRQGSQDLLRSGEAFVERLNQDSQMRGVVRDIDEVEQRVEAATAPRARLEKLIAELFTGTKQIHFSDKGGISVQLDEKGRIPLSALSSGEKQVLRIFLETLLASESSIIIDEPELSMHVDWQRRLVAAMQQLNRSAQLVLATHSPEIMADVADSKIFRM